MSDQDQKNILPNEETPAPIRPSDVTKIAPNTDGQSTPPAATLGQSDTGSVKKLKTIKLKPLKTVAPATSPSDEETISMSREEVSTISSKPDDDATVGIDKKAAQPVQQTTTQEDEDATVKISKAQKPVATPTPPPIPGVKQTIKLRPSTGVSAETSPAPAVQDASPTKQTIKLTPTQPPPTAEPPSAQAPSATSQEPTKQTIKLTAKKPSAPTVKLDTPEAPQAEAPASQVSSSKRTLKLKTTQNVPPPPASADAGMATEHGAPVPGAEPPQVAPQQAQPQISYDQPAVEQASALCTIAASISMIALGYFFYRLFTQFKDLFM